MLAVVLADILGLPPPSLISLSLTSLYFSQLACLLPALGWRERQKHTTICDTLSSNMILNSPGFLRYHFLIISVHLVLQSRSRPPSCTRVTCPLHLLLLPRTGSERDPGHRTRHRDPQTRTKIHRAKFLNPVLKNKIPSFLAGLRLGLAIEKVLDGFETD